ncbi:YsnF/AvaK domain-containing protein [Lysobacter xanthus]
MATTLVGMFDSLADAERARDLLLREGVERGAVHLANNESLTATTTTETTVSGSDAGEHRGFFSRLFGLDDNDTTADNYSQAVRQGSAMLTVTLPDDSDASRVTQLLESAGAVDVDERARQSGGQTRGASLQSDTTRTTQGTRGDTLKVVQEELQVGKRAVETGGVRVRQFVTERPVQEQLQLCQERAIVERRPVDRVLQAGEIDSIDLGDREFEIRERGEEAVVAKQARVVEEVAVGKEAQVRTETIEDTVRRQDVDVEQLTARNAQRQPGTTQRTPPLR